LQQKFFDSRCWNHACYGTHGGHGPRWHGGSGPFKLEKWTMPSWAFEREAKE
jgi:hypothetical protein